MRGGTGIFTLASAALIGAMGSPAALPRPAGQAEPRRIDIAAHGNRRDPFRGIASKGRTGARARAEDLADAFRETRVGKRQLRGRAFSNPFKLPAREKAFGATVIALQGVVGSRDKRRALAAQTARRVVV